MTIPHELLDFLKSSDDFFLASHIDPEGDALGATLALSLGLKQIGKRVTVFNRDGVPEIYHFLPGYAEITTKIPERIGSLILMDCNSLKRAGLEKTMIDFSAVIDHHITENSFGDIRWIQPTAPATGFMVFFLLKKLGIEINEEIALNLYAAMGIDTGIFRYSNTTAECMTVAGELIRRGADPGFVAEKLYNNYSLNRFLLLKKVLNNVDIHDHIAITGITEAMYSETGTSGMDTENFVNFMLMVKEIQIAVLLREVDRDSWKASIRSKGKIDISKVAVFFGGGGHKNAAGCLVEGRLDEAKNRIFEKLREIEIP